MALFKIIFSEVTLDDERWERLVNQTPMFPASDPDRFEKAWNYIAQQELGQRAKRSRTPRREVHAARPRGGEGVAAGRRRLRPQGDRAATWRGRASRRFIRRGA